MVEELTLQQQVIDFRVRHELSQKGAAKALKITVDTLSKYEHGRLPRNKVRELIILKRMQEYEEEKK